jgi:hypothetical protein
MLLSFSTITSLRRRAERPWAKAAVQHMAAKASVNIDFFILLSSGL